MESWNRKKKKERFFIFFASILKPNVDNVNEIR